MSDSSAQQMLNGGSSAREAELEKHLSTLLERESARAIELASALESAAAVANERDELIRKLRAQQQQIEHLNDTVDRKERALAPQGLPSGGSSSDLITTDLSSLQNHITMQNAELVKILEHLAHPDRQRPEARRETMPSGTRYFRVEEEAAVQRQIDEKNTSFNALIAEVSDLQSRLNSGGGSRDLSMSISDRLQGLRAALESLQKAQEEERQAADLRHKFDTISTVSKGVKDLMIDSLRPSVADESEARAEDANTRGAQEGSSVISSTKQMGSTENVSSLEQELESLLRWKSHAEEVMKAMRAEVSETIATSIELERTNQELEDDRRNLALRLDESFGRIDLLERTVVNLKRQSAAGGGNEAEYRTQLEATIRQMQDRFEVLKAKYVKQGKRTRELQVKLLHLARQQKHGHPDEEGDGEAPDSHTYKHELPVQVADALRSAGRDAGMDEEEGVSDDARGPAEAPMQSIEQVPTDVLERIEVLQDTRRLLYTAPSSQNRRPLPPEIPVPAEVLEAQRLSDEHRTALQSAPSSQLLRCIRHMDSWHEGDSDQVVLRPESAPSKRDTGSPRAPTASNAPFSSGSRLKGTVFMPEPRRNNYFHNGSDDVAEGVDGGRRTSRPREGREKRSGSSRPQKVRLSNRRPASAYAAGNANRVRVAAGAKKARRPASASHARMTASGRSAALKLITSTATPQELEDSHQITVPLTPQFAEVLGCDQRRGCPCHSKKPISASRARSDVAKSTDGKSLKPWK